MRTMQENGKEFVIIPAEEYAHMLAASQINDNDYDEMLGKLATNRDDEAFPITLFDRIDSGESALKLFREYRAISQKELGQAIGKKPAYISMLESGKREGSLPTIKAIAQALNVELDLLA
jgi:DNA-binding XRE family transcriptional regulator